MLISWPLLGVNVKVVVDPSSTVCGELGLIEPPDPAEGVTVKVGVETLSEKDATTVQSEKTKSVV